MHTLRYLFSQKLSYLVSVGFVYIIKTYKLMWQKFELVIQDCAMFQFGFPMSVRKVASEMCAKCKRTKDIDYLWFLQGFVSVGYSDFRKFRV